MDELRREWARWEFEDNIEQGLLIDKPIGHYIISRPDPYDLGDWRVIAGPFETFDLANQMLAPIWRGIDKGICKAITKVGTYTNSDTRKGK